MLPYRPVPFLSNASIVFVVLLHLDLLVARYGVQLRLCFSAKDEVDAALMVTSVLALLTAGHTRAWPLAAFNDVTDLLFPFEPPSVTINAVKVQFNILVCDFQTFDCQSGDITFLFRLAHFFNNLLDKLAAFNLELGLDLIC